MNFGRSLADTMESAIEEMADDDNSRADIVDELGSEAGIDSSTVNDILNANINCPPMNRLEGFARVLDVSVQTLRSAAEEDGCEYNSDESSIDNDMLSAILPNGSEVNVDSRSDVQKIQDYAQEEANRLARDKKSELSKLKTRLDELSSAKELLVDEVCRRKALSEDSFDASEDREKVAALSVSELEEQLSALSPAENVEPATGNEEPSGEGVYSFAN